MRVFNKTTNAESNEAFDSFDLGTQGNYVANEFVAEMDFALAA